jgi:Zn-dependent peptidase ImmA (M78 family)
VRANQIGAITANQYQYLMKQISQRGYRTNEPLDDAYQLILPRYLKQAMIMIKKDKKVSGNEFMHMLKSMQLSLHESMVERLLNLEEGFLVDGNSGSETLLKIR